VDSGLAYCINVVEPKHIVVEAQLFKSFESARAHITADAKVWLHGDAGVDDPRVDHAVAALPGDDLPPSERPALTIEDRALYIYTSGTTGLPKAANLNHYRVMLATHAFAGVMNTRPTDRMYDCLPLYHTVGGLLATGAPLLRGGSVVIRDRFSVQEFWRDIARWDCTCFQYIGELCRYLLNAPAQPDERSHRLRFACGNGLRFDVWKQFAQRFRIPQIIEFYGATEGNVTLFNLDGKEGAVGRLPWWLAHRFAIKVVRFDPERQLPARDKRGFCVECAFDEVGEVIGKILSDPSQPGARFEGYTSQSETENKILHDVFEKGDVWFRTGDLMRKDKRGYFYFVDRIGDTFRWKGENVSTTEVELVLDQFDGIVEANVYGVAIEGRDGRAGMAAVVAKDNLDLAALHEHLVRRLPDYARPVFLRIRRDIDVTSTFKQKKLLLVQESFDPARSEDPIYFNDPRSEAFVRIDAEIYRNINVGKIRI
jgi:fatty-acyl-CoA synthase